MSSPAAPVTSSSSVTTAPTLSSASSSVTTKPSKKEPKVRLPPEEWTANRAERRIIVADHDKDGVYCYQAYKPSIGLAAVEKQNFVGIKDFSPTRMTWSDKATNVLVDSLRRRLMSSFLFIVRIKFSLGWMLYRCDYGRSKDQEVVLRIKLSWEAFWTILREAVGSTYDATVFDTQDAWKKAMGESTVRYQWDPARDVTITKLPNNQRDLQLGLSKHVGTSFATNPKWILSIENYTSVAKDIRSCMDEGRTLPKVPEETEIQVDEPELRRTLGMGVRAEVADESSSSSSSLPSASVAPIESTEAKE